MCRKRSLFIVSIAVFLLLHSPVSAEVTPFTVWTSEARSLLPQWVQYWIYFMFLMTGTGLLFVKDHVEARWSVGAFVASHLASAFEILVFGQDGFVVGMISINHCVFWTPTALYLLTRLKAMTLLSPFGIWMVGMLVVFSFSLIFDYRDAFIYLTSSPGN